MKTCTLLIVFILYGFLGQTDGLSGHVCQSKRSRSQTYYVQAVRYKSERYTTKCGVFGWSRCTRYRSKAEYYQAPRTRVVYYNEPICCSGWKLRSGQYCDIPVCSRPCLNLGRCTAPSRCSCTMGYTGSTCQNPPVCPTLHVTSNGALRCTQNNRVGSTCTFSCLAGYVIPVSQRSLATKVCRVPGNWGDSSIVPKCSAKRPPASTNCPTKGHNITTSSPSTEVSFPLPTFISHSGQNIQAKCNYGGSSGKFTLPWGYFEIRCSGFDSEIEETASCVYTLGVLPNSAPLQPPRNGALACASWIFGLYCQLYCRDGYDIPRDKSDSINGEFLCDMQGKWHPVNTVPDCIAKKTKSQPLRMKKQFYFKANSCAFFQRKIQEMFIINLQSSPAIAVCSEHKRKCKADNVNVQCGAQE